MGFRCIKCKQDFGKDKDAFSEHIAICTGVQKDTLEKAVITTCEHVTKCIAAKGMLNHKESETT